MAEEDVKLVEGPPKKKKGKGKLLIVALLLVVAIAGGVVYAMRRSATPAGETAPSNPGLIPMDPFVVNLADAGGLRFLRVTLQIEVADDKEAVRIAEDPVPSKRARSAILELLSQQTAATLVTSDGKVALKKAIMQAVAPIFPSTKVIDVLFLEFVVQF